MLCLTCLADIRLLTHTHTHILILTHLAIPFLAGNGARIRVAESGQGDSEDTEAHPPAGEPKKNRESARRWFVVGCHP